MHFNPQSKNLCGTLRLYCTFIMIMDPNSEEEIQEIHLSPFSILNNSF